MRFDAAIVGGGAAGSMLAWKMAEKGWRVIVFEKKKEVGGKVCGGLISERVIKFSGTEVIMNKIKGARIIFPGGKEVIIGGDKTHAYVIDRDAFDKEMMEKAMAEGAEYVKGFKVRRIEKNKIEGKEEIEFDYLVGADGALSRVASIYNMGETETIGAIQGHWNGEWEEEYVTVYFNNSISPGFFSWAIPDGEKVRIGLGSMEGKTKGKLHMLEKKLGVKIKDAKGSVIPLGMRKLCKKNVALIGDAAGQIKATSGGGLYAITVAVESLSESFPDLKEYERKFMERFGKEIKKTVMARKMFLRLNNDDIDYLGELVEKDVDMINKYGDLDYQSEVGMVFLKRHWLNIGKLIIKNFFRWK